jgi:hypothetical protein
MTITLPHTSPRGQPGARDHAAAQVSRTFAAGPAAAAAGRRFAQAAVRGWSGGPCPDDLLQVASELIANAAAAEPGDGQILLRLTATPALVLVEAGDHNQAAPPAQQVPDPDLERGRGLLIVTALASAAGWYADGEWKIVWASVVIPACTAAAVTPAAPRLQPAA